MKLLDVIKESQELSELFGSNYVYPVTVKEDRTEKSRFSETVFRTLRYEFTTKDDVIYDVLFTINLNKKEGRLDFLTSGAHFSMFPLINTHDAIKVFNTLKSIIDKHRDQMNKLEIHSRPDRLAFYKKILDHLNIGYKKINSQTIVANV